MKHRILTLLCLACLAIQGVQAQSFLKKLGKAVEKAGKEALAGGSSTNETPWGHVTVKNTIPNFSVQLQNVQRKGNKAYVTLLFENKTSSKFQLWGLNARKLFDDQSNQYNTSCMVGNEGLTIGDSYSYFESEAPVKVVCAFEPAANDAVTVRLLKFETSYIQNGKRVEAPIEIRNFEVPSQTTAAPAVSQSQQPTAFKGTWSYRNTQSKSEVVVELYGEKKMTEDEVEAYGYVYVAHNNAARIDNNYITSISVRGNMAEFEYICDRVMDDDCNPGKGRGQLVLNPATQTMVLKCTDYPEATYEGCYIPEVQTLQKEK